MPIIRSEQLNEFISIKPSWMVRSGISLFFIIVVALIGCTWFIQYPEIVSVSVKVKVTNPPKEVYVKQGGQLSKLFKNDGDSVSVGEVIGFTESIASHKEVIALGKLMEQLKEKTTIGNIEEMPQYWLQANVAFTHLGDLQVAHQNFIQAFLIFKNYVASGYYVTKKEMLQKDIITAKKLYKNLIIQKELQQEDFTIAEKNYNINKKMHQENLINDFELRSQKSQWINKKMSVPQMATTMLNAEAQQNNIVKEVMDLDKQTVEQKNNFIQALYTYHNTIEDWKNKNCIIAPENGIIHFNNFITEKQQIEQGKAFCYITNTINETSAEILIANNDISKIKENMEINLKFAAFPYQDYGIVKGIIKIIKQMPTDSGFIALVLLPKGLNTSRDKFIPFSYGLQAQGEIFTENRRLFTKILNGIVKK